MNLTWGTEEEFEENKYRITTVQAGREVFVFIGLGKEAVEERFKEIYSSRNESWDIMMAKKVKPRAEVHYVQDSFGMALNPVDLLLDICRLVNETKPKH